VGSDNSLTQLFQYSDTVGNSIPHVTGGGLTKLGFFFDDTATGSEATNNGKVYDLRIWSGAALSAQTLGEAVVRPSSVTNIVANPAAQSINVSWSAVTGATSYLATAGNYSCTVNAPITTCTITGLSDGTSVTVNVQAIGPGGYSAVASSASPVVVGATTTTSTTAAPSGGAATTTTVAPETSETTGTLPKSGNNNQLVLVAVLLLTVGAVLVLARSRREQAPTGN
jgi:LPXTG-motif cell wall-anchored protein